MDHETVRRDLGVSAPRQSAKASETPAKLEESVANAPTPLSVPGPQVMKTSEKRTERQKESQSTKSPKIGESRIDLRKGDFREVLSDIKQIAEFPGRGYRVTVFRAHFRFGSKWNLYRACDHRFWRFGKRPPRLSFATILPGAPGAGAFYQRLRGTKLTLPGSAGQGRSRSSGVRQDRQTGRPMSFSSTSKSKS